MIAVIRQDDADNVPQEDGCPACGELHVDWLQWMPDELVLCVRCDCRYWPGSDIAATSYSASRGELIQRVVPTRGPHYRRYCPVSALEAVAGELAQAEWLGASEAELRDALASYGTSAMACRAAVGFLSEYGFVNHHGDRYSSETPDLVEAALAAYQALPGVADGKRTAHDPIKPASGGSL